MISYENKNVNPKGRKTGDCSTRALVGTLGIDYDEALRLQCEASIKTKYGITDKQTMEYILKQFGYVKQAQPRWEDNTKVKVQDLDEYLSWCCRDEWLDKTIFVTIANHHTCIVNGKVQDIWDCRRKTIGNYYVKVD